MDALSQLNIGLAGRYRIDREIGAGGMATVYLARDLRHDRLVAVKVLKRELGAMLGAERFLGEIRVTANLQHPNLLPLFDSGESDGLLYYVMPYVDGESLRQRLDRERQLPIDEVCRLAVAICGALGYAHRHGVIHRDLKPENVLLHDGQPMIADFGIALAISNAAGVRLTQSGISVGTPQYMSPEQAASDRAIDARSDIYAVGALTYEMLTGEAPHTGHTAQAIVARLMTEEPRPVSSLRRLVPAHLDAAVHRALQKLPADRFATAQELADALSGKTPLVLPREAVPSRPPRAWKVATAVFAALSVAAVVWAMTRRAAPAQPLRFSLALPDSAAIDASSFLRSLDLSPDGTQLVYVGANGLFIRLLNDLTPRRLTMETGRDPRFSPDGAWVAYLANDVLRKVPAGGGPAVTIVDSVGRYGWGSKGTIVFTRSGSAVADLWRISDKGGPPERFVHQLRPNDNAYGSPVFLPDGDTFLVPLAASGDNVAEIAAYRFSDHRMRYLGVRGDHPLFLDGLLLHVGADENVYASPLDTRTLSVRGTPTRVFAGVMRKGSSAEMAISATGSMAYLPGVPPNQLVEYDRAGRQRDLGLPAGGYGVSRYSPDGRRVAVAVRQGSASDIVVYDLSTLTPRQLTTNGRAATPEWMRAGRRVGWTETQGAVGMRIAELKGRRILWRAADGSDSATVLIPDALGMVFSPATDAGVVVTERGGHPVLDLIEHLGSTPRATQILELGGPSAARISPDGNWLAYQSAVPGRPTNVFIRRLPAGAPYQISTGGGTEPMWNPAGGELFYRAGTQFIVAKLALGSEEPVTRRDPLPFRLPTPANGVWASYDVSPEGQRFLLAKPTAGNDQPIVITRWLDDVREQLKTPR